MSKVSVVMPVYNRKDTIERSVNSVLNQSYNDLELIIIDDYSTDGTRQVLDSISDEKIKTIYHKKNRGACAARNTGIKQSSSEYIAFIDSDDEWHVDKIKKQIKVFKNNSDKVGVVYTGYQKNINGLLEIGKVPEKSGYIFHDLLKKDWINPTSTVMVRRECFYKTGFFNTDIDARQDYYQWLRIAQEYQFEFIKDVLVTLHTDSDNRLTDDPKGRIRAHKKLLSDFDHNINSLGYVSKRRAYSSQYYNMARYLQTQREFNHSLIYCIKSLIQNPFKYKTYLVLFLSILHIDAQQKLFIKIKNILRRKINKI